MDTRPADYSHKSPERHIEEALGLVKAASLNNRYLFVTQKYAYSLAHTVIVVCYVTCPDAMAIGVRQAMDKAVEDVFAEHGLTIHKPH